MKRELQAAGPRVGSTTPKTSVRRVAVAVRVRMKVAPAGADHELGGATQVEALVVVRVGGEYQLGTVVTQGIHQRFSLGVCGWCAPPNPELSRG
jgi:hypothetical protein